MIVVEGPDGSGKTSMVERLLRRYPRLEQYPRAVNSDAEYQQSLDGWVQDLAWKDGMGTPLIVDRHQLISHPIYGPTMRRKLHGQFEDLDWFNMHLQAFWETLPVVILCLPPIEEVKKNLEVDEHKVAQADIDVYWWTYHFWLASNIQRPRVFHYDYTEFTSRATDTLVEHVGAIHELY